MSSTTPSNMEGPSTPKHPRVSSIQHAANVGRTPSFPTPHYVSSTNINDAKTNLKAILATRVSYNDPKIVDVLVKPDQVSDELVKTIRTHILGHQVTKDFLDAVSGQTVRLESEMYKPLVRRSGYPCSPYSRSE